MCYPQLIPGYITALYIFTVVNLAILLNFTLVDADIIVKNRDNHTIDEGIADLPAAFGPAIPDEGVWGHLIYSNPLDACKHIEPPPKFPKNDTGGIGNKWIALIKRGGCNFDVKILHAQEAGFVAAIVHNVNGSNELINMGAGRKEPYHIVIQSVFIGDRNGRILGDNFNNNPHYNIVIDDTPQENYGLALVIFVVFGTIIGVSFLTLIIIGIVKWVRDVRRRQRSRLSKQHLKKIPVHKFKKGDPYDVCAICLDEYEEGDKLRVLPCNHAYHRNCIDPWLTKNKKTCPICKKKVIPGRERESDSDSESETDEENENEAQSENTPLLRGNRDNNNGSRPRGDAFDNSGIPERFRPRLSRDSDESSDDSSVDPMHSVYQSSVEVHSEPDNRTRVRPPKRRGALNTRYALVSENPTDRFAERPLTAPPLVRPRAHRAWEFGISPASSPSDRDALLGATGGSDVDRSAADVDVDDVAPPRPMAFSNPALLDPMSDHIESHMDNSTANQLPGTSRSGTRPRHAASGRSSQDSRPPGARPRRKPRDADGLLLVHKTDQHRKSASKNSVPHGSKKKPRASERAVEAANVENIQNNAARKQKQDKNTENETTKSADDQAQIETETGHSPPKSEPRIQASPNSDSNLGAVGGMDDAVVSTADLQATEAGSDGVEVVRPSSRNKKKSKKKRKRDDEA